MRTIKVGMSGNDVKVLQAYLKHRGFKDNSNTDVSTDGKFGIKTKEALINFQKYIYPNTLKEWDGICGTKTWDKLAYYCAPITNSKFWIQKIPFDKFTRINMYIHNGERKSIYSYNTQYWDLVSINGPMFNMGGGIYSWYNTSDIVINGKLQDYGGNYTNKGIAFKKNNGKYAGVQSTTEECLNKNDIVFIAGTPICIQDSKINYDTKGISSSFMSPKAKAYRHGIGITDTEFVKISTALDFTCSIPDLTNEALRQGCKTFINLDGGGSVAEAVANQSIYSQGRGVPSAIGLIFGF